MLAPMMLGKRHKAFFYANISLLFSLLGSLVGYALGHWAFHALTPLLAVLASLRPDRARRGKPSHGDEPALA